MVFESSVPSTEVAKISFLCAEDIKETSFVCQDKRGFLLLSGQNTGLIIEKRALERSIGCYGARFFAFSGRNCTKTPVYFLSFFAPQKIQKCLGGRT